MWLLYVLLTISVLNTNTATRLVCLYCTDAVSPVDCDTVKTCGPHESCYVDTFVIASGSIRYNLGCRDKNQCNGSSNSGRRELTITSFYPPEIDDAMLNTEKALPHALTYKSPNYVFKSRDVSIRTNGLLICSECCNENLCSNSGCGNKGYISPRGPICYSCTQQISPDDCFKIRLCHQGEVCMLLKTRNPMSKEIRYTTKCESEMSCNDEIIRYQQLAELLVGKREKRNSFESGGSCIVQCCKSDMCNTNCNKPYSSTTVAPPTTTFPVSQPQYSSTTVPPPSTTFLVPQLTTTSAFVNPNNNPCQNHISNCDAYTKYVCSGEYFVWASANCARYCGFCVPKTCYYDGKYYHEGEQWRDGCKYKCTCQDGKIGRYSCQSLCLQWALPQSCHLDPPPSGKCCQVPVCPSNVQLQYPPGFVQE